MLKTFSGGPGKSASAPSKVKKQDVQKGGSFTGKYAASSVAQSKAPSKANLGEKAKMKGRMGTR